MHEGYDQKDCTTTYAVLHLITKTLFLSIVGGYFLLQKYLFNYPFESRTHEIVIIILMVSIYLETIIDIPKAKFWSKNRTSKTGYP